MQEMHCQKSFIQSASCTKFILSILPNASLDSSWKSTLHTCPWLLSSMSLQSLWLCFWIQSRLMVWTWHPANWHGPFASCLDFHTEWAKASLPHPGGLYPGGTFWSRHSSESGHLYGSFLAELAKVPNELQRNRNIIYHIIFYNINIWHRTIKFANSS